jgi:hypothetical protein
MTWSSRLWEASEATDLLLLFDHAASILIPPKSNKLRVSQMIDLRLILHLFTAWASKPQTIGLLNLESA